MEDELHDNVSMRVLAASVAPDETTICKFRHLLEKHKLAKKLLATSQRYLDQRGLIVRSGTIADVTIILVSASTKNKKRRRDNMGKAVACNVFSYGRKCKLLDTIPPKYPIFGASLCGCWLNSHASRNPHAPDLVTKVPLTRLAILGRK